MHTSRALRDIVLPTMAGDPFGLIGTVIDGQFRVDQWIGEGGFSVVYKGFHLGLNEPVAIKVLKMPEEHLKDAHEEFTNRFRDESRIAYRLSQGNLHIVRSITSGSTKAPATGQLALFMVLEWLEGFSLAEDLRKRRDAHLTGRPVEEVMRIFAPAAEALAYAHAHGVVHRDVKPGNLFLASTREGHRMKVLDFGMAKILSDGTLGMSPLAQSMGNVMVFSAPYAAPEQFDPKIAPIGAWTDVYSFGLVLLEALSDRRVRGGESLAECLMQACDSNRKPSPRALGVQVSDGLEAVFARAVSINKGERPQDVGEFWGLLKNAMLRDGDKKDFQVTPMESEPPDSNDDPATIVHDTRGMFDEAGNLTYDPHAVNSADGDEPTRTVDLNALNATFKADAGGPQLPREVTDFLNRAPAPGPAAGKPAERRLEPGGHANYARLGPPPIPQQHEDPMTGAATLMQPLNAPAPGQIQPLGQARSLGAMAGGGQTFPEPFEPLDGGASGSDRADVTVAMSPGANPGALGRTMPLSASPYAAEYSAGSAPPFGAPPQGFGVPQGPPPPLQAQYTAGGYVAPGAPTQGQIQGQMQGQMQGGPQNQGAVAQSYVAPGVQPQWQGNVAYGNNSGPKSRLILYVAAGGIAFLALCLAGFVLFRVWQMRQASLHVSNSQQPGTITATTVTDPSMTPVPVGGTVTPTPEAVSAAPPPVAAPLPVAPVAPPPAEKPVVQAPPPVQQASPPPVQKNGGGAPPQVHNVPNTPPPVAGGGAGPGPMKSVGPPATPPPAEPDPTVFNVSQAQSSLRSMESILSSCKRPEGPTGVGKVRVTFANDGTVMTSTVMGAPFEGTPVGDCASGRFKMAKVHSFDGPPGVADYTFHINK
jgi:serine/threonine protein kinase